MSKVLIVGDPHIGGSFSLGKSGYSNSLNTRLIDQINLLNWCLDLSYENGVTDIVLTGDVFDDPTCNYSIVQHVLDWVLDCSIKDINVHIIFGNHDTLRTGFNYYSPLDIFEKINHEMISIYKSISSLVINNIQFTFLPFFDRKSMGLTSNEEALNQIKIAIDYESKLTNLKKVLIGHMALEGSLYIGDEIDDLKNELICPLSFFDNYNHVWMGHVHAPQVLKKEPHIAHIGSMDICNFGEANHEKIVILYDCESSSFKEIKIPVRKLQSIKINIPEDCDDPDSFIKDSLENLSLENIIVKLELNNQSSIKCNKSTLEKFLKEKGTFNIPSIIEHAKSKTVKVNDTEYDDGDLILNIKTYANDFIPDESKVKFVEIASSIASSLNS